MPYSEYPDSMPNKVPVLQDSISTRTDRGFNLQINQEHGIHSMDEKKGDLDPLPNKNNNNDMGYVIPLILAAAVAGLVFVGQSLDFGSLLSEAVSKVEELGPYGYLYFACVSATLSRVRKRTISSPSQYHPGMIYSSWYRSSTRYHVLFMSYIIGFLGSCTLYYLFILCIQFLSVDRGIGGSGSRVGREQVYIAAEILAIPVFPLTSSSGYLFGLLPGTLLVLTCATIAASISFYIGRTFLRAWAQDLIKGQTMRCTVQCSAVWCAPLIRGVGGGASQWNP